MFFSILSIKILLIKLDKPFIYWYKYLHDIICFDMFWNSEHMKIVSLKYHYITCFILLCVTVLKQYHNTSLNFCFLLYFTHFLFYTVHLHKTELQIPSLVEKRRIPIFIQSNSIPTKPILNYFVQSGKLYCSRMFSPRKTKTFM